MPVGRRRLDAAIVAGVVVTALAAWYFRLIAPAHQQSWMLGTNDFYMQIYPMWVRAAEWMRSGSLPLWNPYQLAGHPFLATGIYGLLYPLNVVYLFLPTRYAIEASIVLHVALCGVFTYAFGTVITVRREAALVMALTFMLSGFVLAEASWFPPALAAAAWLPLALLAIERISGGGLGRGVALLAVALAMGLLAGWPQTWLYSVWVVLAYAGARSLSLVARRSWRELVAMAVAAAAGVAIACLLAAPQLLPTLELQALGPRRAGGLSLAQAVLAAVLTPRMYLEQALDPAPAWPRNAYLGFAALLLMPLSLLARRPWRAVCFALLLLFALSIAAALFPPAFHLYRWLGGMSFRAPMRIFYVYAFAGAMLAGLGYDELARVSETKDGRARILGVAVAFALLVVVSSASARGRVYACAALALIMLAVVVQRAGLKRAALLSLLLLGAADLLFSAKNPYFRPFHTTLAYRRDGEIYDFIVQNQGLDRTYIASPMETPSWMAKLGTLRRIYSVTDYEPLSSSRFERLFGIMEAPADRRPEALTFTGSLHSNPSWPGFRLLDMFGVRYVVLPKSALAEQNALRHRLPRWRLVLSPDDGDALLYENPRPLPRAYFVAQAVVAPSEDLALLTISGDVFDPRTTALLEPPEPSKEAVEAIVASSAVPNGAGDLPLVPAEIASYEPRRAVVHVDAPKAGYLVISDAFYPGWVATVDGAPTPILRANFVLRAVSVGPGRHEVVFRYEPRSFRVGLGLGFVGLVALVVAFLENFRRRVEA